MERRSIRIEGLVQGVGFRPFVHELACGLSLSGFVRNHSGSVLIEVEGESGTLDAFVQALGDRRPPLARIDRIEWNPTQVTGAEGFEIRQSSAGQIKQINVCPDVATCGDCLRELLDARDRRFRYPFINCTNCGPRLTIIKGAPYDRHRTTMAEFEMCPACRREYEDPRDRRFHAQPVACAACGPRLCLLDAAGKPYESADPLAKTVMALRGRAIAAIKGLGGFHLACRADDARAVTELRKRKHRDEKPFAVMLCNLAAVEQFCHIEPLHRELLESPARPIVLIPRQNGGRLVDAVAPGNPNIGVMLPYTPLHHLLLGDLNGVPLVMTSGNWSDEPIAYENEDAASRLSGIADLFLVHDRAIQVRCDDSVVRTVAGRPGPIRRSRGYAPQSVKLPFECAVPILAVGGQLKSTFALGRDRNAILSHHLGDLDHLDAFRAFVRDVELYQRLFEIEPRHLAHDLHPDYASTRYAVKERERRGNELIPIQHHHAHVASCMAEHGLEGSVIGVSFDGTGFGTDGAVWGGEFLVCDYLTFRRAAHFRYVPMPGGERAIHEPWRMAAAHLMDAGMECESLQKRIDPTQWRTCRRMIERQFNCPLTSSVGRLFDAVASLVGLRNVVSYEAQAAMELEWAAAGEAGEYPFALSESNSSDGTSEFPPLPWGEGRGGGKLRGELPARGPYPNPLPEGEGVKTGPLDGAALTIDTRPFVRAIVEDVARGVDRPQISRRFHFTLAKIILAACRQIRWATQFSRVLLTGGTFINEILTADTIRLLRDDGFDVFRHETLPTGDGGLSLGQLAIAAARLGGGAKE
jgi:hydrogenase maturation protein HypF